MYTWKITFTINGKRMQEVVQANTKGEAQNIIKMRYPGQRINFISEINSRLN